MTEADKNIPFVDLALSDEEASILVKQACEGAGFFYIRNHGIPQALQGSLMAQVRSLFDLPLEDKLKLSQDKNNRGYTAFEEEVLDPDKAKGRGDTKEGYYIGVDIPEDDPRAHKLMHGPNQWPPTELLPGFRLVMDDYFQACLRVCNRLLLLMALALGLPPSHFLQKGFFDQAMAVLRLLHYSPEASSPERGVFGCGAHTDYGMLTLLLTGGPGLQICREADKEPQAWEAVEDVEGAIVVNVGDMLQRWTNGRWRSTLHRVIIPPDCPSDRYSVPFFFDLNFDCVVECLPTCTSPDDPPRWPPIKFGDHLLHMYKMTHMNLDESIKAS